MGEFKHGKMWNQRNNWYNFFNLWLGTNKHPYEDKWLMWCLIIIGQPLHVGKCDESWCSNHTICNGDTWCNQSLCAIFLLAKWTPHFLTLEGHLFMWDMVKTFVTKQQWQQRAKRWFWKSIWNGYYNKSPSAFGMHLIPMNMLGGVLHLLFRSRRDLTFRSYR